MRRLKKVPGMTPYIELAYTRADENAEKQALAISAAVSSSSVDSVEKIPTSKSRKNSRVGLVGDSARSRAQTVNGKSRISVASSTSSRDSDLGAMSHWNSTLFTFSAGVLPKPVAHDPVTPICNLFQQGAPLCLIFNAIRPEHKIDAVSSDDLKVCKMNVYQFLSACKLNLNIRDDELFPITSVFSDDIRNLLEVIHSVNLVLDLDPRFDVSPVEDQLVVSDERSKVVKELVESERKYVYDLELLCKYKDELMKKELISSDDINMLFPNMNEIVDFQRRILLGLECNAVVAPEFQRLGSVFVHAGVEGFQIYEAWSLFQNSAMEFITKEADSLIQSSSVIGSPYELQSFLIKPVQRLCKYPLLLKSLLKLTKESWQNYGELQTAYEITCEVGNTINEAQRKSENIQLLKQLQEQVVDWKGFSLSGVGELLYANVVTVKDLLNEGHSGEKEVHCYLFEHVIYFFKEHREKSGFLGGHRKSSGSSTPSSHHKSYGSDRNRNSGGLSSANHRLSLNGIVYINKIYRVTSSDTSPYFSAGQGHYLTLRWRGNRDTGGCVFKFRSEEHMGQWEAAILRLSGCTNGSSGNVSTISSISNIGNIGNNSINSNVSNASKASNMNNMNNMSNMSNISSMNNTSNTSNTSNISNISKSDYSYVSAPASAHQSTASISEGSTSYFGAAPSSRLRTSSVAGMPGMPNSAASGTVNGGGYPSMPAGSLGSFPQPPGQKQRSVSSPAAYLPRVRTLSSSDLPPVPQYDNLSTNFSRMNISPGNLKFRQASISYTSAPGAGGGGGGGITPAPKAASGAPTPLGPPIALSASTSLGIPSSTGTQKPNGPLIANSPLVAKGPQSSQAPPIPMGPPTAGIYKLQQFPPQHQESRRLGPAPISPPPNVFPRTGRSFSQPSSPFENRIRIKLVYGGNGECVHVSVSPGTSFVDLTAIIVDRLNYIMTADGAAKRYELGQIKLKFQDEDGDMIRFQDDADWAIAKDMLNEIREEERRVLTLRIY